MFHVSSSSNRESILTHGLDSNHMAESPGIAGSRTPEQDGCFLCEGEDEAEWLVSMNNTGGPVDVWAVDGVDEQELVESPEGYFYSPRAIAPDRVTLLRTDIPPDGDRWNRSPSHPELEIGSESGPIGTMIRRIEPESE